MSASGGGTRQLRARGDTLVVYDRVFGYGDRYLPDADSASRLLAGADLRDTLARLRLGKPIAATAHLRSLIGEYGPDYDILYIFERDARLWALIEWFFPYPLTEVAPDTFAFPPSGLYDGEQIVFVRDLAGRTTEARAAGVRFTRRHIEPKAGTNQLRITPLRPVAELRSEALVAQPPQETGHFRDADLVELTALDASIKLEIRYATSNNFARLSPAAGRRGARPRSSSTQSVRLWFAHPRCLSTVVCDEDLLGRHAAGKEVARGRSVAGLQAQPRICRRPHPLRSPNRPRR
jgi:hypothetical protein